MFVLAGEATILNIAQALHGQKGHDLTRSVVFSAFFWLLRSSRAAMVAIIGGAVKDIISGIPEYEEEV